MTTIEQDNTADKNNVTEWTLPETQMDTQYGRLSYEDWLGEEQDRLAQGGIKTQIITKDVSLGGATVVMMALQRV